MMKGLDANGLFGSIMCHTTATTGVPPGFRDPWCLHIANMMDQTKLLSEQAQLDKAVQEAKNQLPFPHDFKNDFDLLTFSSWSNN